MLTSQGASLYLVWTQLQINLVVSFEKLDLEQIE
jgi:hypothetical protein